MAKERILLVENEVEIQQLVSSTLVKQGYKVTCAATGEQALSILGNDRPNLLLLDIMLPGIDGLQLCKSVRSAESSREIPIIMLIDQGKESDIVAGLTMGADDYLTKPISPKILLARISVVLRRTKTTREDEISPAMLRIHNMEIDVGRHEVRVDGSPVNLTITEFRILRCLTERPGWVLTRQQVIDRVRGDEFLVTPRLVDVQIFGLRKKLGMSGSLIETVRGIGYRFKA